MSVQLTDDQFSDMGKSHSCCLWTTVHVTSVLRFSGSHQLHHCPAGKQLNVQLLFSLSWSHLTGHCWDKSSSTSTPLLRLDEGDLTVRRQVPDHFVEPVTEAEIKKERSQSLEYYFILLLCQLPHRMNLISCGLITISGN